MKNFLELAARMALLAYSDTPVMDGFTICPFSAENIQGFAARKDDDLWIVFCGTNDAEDWLDNLDARKEETGSGCVHAGFNQALDEVWDTVLSAINQTDWNCIHFVGHSMGGALAALAASRSAQIKMWMETYLWTFGQPRCGDSQWAEKMHFFIPKPSIRVLNAGDLVPHLPTCLRFTHAGLRIYFDHKGRPIKPTLWHRMSSGFKALVTHRKAALVTLQSHAMSQYLANVRKTLEEQ